VDKDEKVLHEVGMFVAGQHRFELFSVGISLQGFFLTLEEKLPELHELDLVWLKGKLNEFKETVDKELESREPITTEGQTDEKPWLLSPAPNIEIKGEKDV
jgi:hypothetical protein